MSNNQFANMGRLGIFNSRLLIFRLGAAACALLSCTACSTLPRVPTATEDEEQIRKAISLPSPSQAAGKEWAANLGNEVVMEFAPVMAGEFWMGSSQGAENERPSRSVTITHNYWMGKTEVTQQQYQQIMGNNPSMQQGMDLPVELVSWDEANEFCQKLSRIESEAGRLPEGLVYRLPTEAEWEYAAKGGHLADESFAYAGSNAIDDVAWFFGNSDGRIHAVGTKAANQLGLYDMTGNVAEWCYDLYQENYRGLRPVDPCGPRSVVIHWVEGLRLSSALRVIRGGDVLLGTELSSRVGARAPGWHTANQPDETYDRFLATLFGGRVGFRVVLAPPVRIRDIQLSLDREVYSVLSEIWGLHPSSKEYKIRVALLTHALGTTEINYLLSPDNKNFVFNMRAVNYAINRYLAEFPRKKSLWLITPTHQRARQMKLDWRDFVEYLHAIPGFEPANWAKKEYLTRLPPGYLFPFYQEAVNKPAYETAGWVLNMIYVNGYMEQGKEPDYTAIEGDSFNAKMFLESFDHFLAFIFRNSENNFNFSNKK